MLGHSQSHVLIVEDSIEAFLKLIGVVSKKSGVDVVVYQNVIKDYPESRYYESAKD